MVPRVDWRDDEQVVIAHLSSVLDAPVFQRVPNPRPSTFVTVYRIGGSSRDVVIDDTTLIVDAWASSPAAAKALALRARSEIHAMPGAVSGVCSVTEFAVVSWLPDPTSDQARYTATYSVAVRAVKA